MKIFTIIILIVISGIWGYYQIKLFPPKNFGCLYIFTSFAGGYCIGYLGSKFLLDN